MARVLSGRRRGFRYTPRWLQAHPIGTQESVRVDTLVLDVLPGDRYLLCSDGLSNYVEDLDDLAARVGGTDVESVPEELVDFANRAGGRDNVTAVVVEIEVDPDERPLALGLTADVEVKLEALGSVFLFEDLTLAQSARVLSSSRVEAYGAGDAVLDEGEPCDRLIVVVEGRFAVARGRGDDRRARVRRSRRRDDATAAAAEPGGGSRRRGRPTAGARGIGIPRPRAVASLARRGAARETGAAPEPRRRPRTGTDAG